VLEAVAAPSRRNVVVHCRKVAAGCKRKNQTRKRLPPYVERVMITDAYRRILKRRQRRDLVWRKEMREKTAFVMLLMTMFIAAGCSQQSHRNKADPWADGCAQWAKTLGAPRAPMTIADVTSLLGQPPEVCGPVEPEWMMGTQVNKKLEIIKVAPGSPAATAGMKPGAKILRINKKKIKKEAALLAAVHSYKEGADALVVQTDKGTYSVDPKKPKNVTECSSRVSDEASGHEKRFFQSTCRFFNGVEAQCKSRCHK